MKLVKSCLMLVMVIALGSCATYAAPRKAKVYVKLIAASTLPSTPAQDGEPTKTTTRLLIVWKGITYPETFFWRGNGGWLTCRIEKATRNASGLYDVERIKNNEIHTGDTLQLTPLSGGKFPIPAEIPVKAKNTLFFKTGGSAWKSFKVNKITTAGVSK